MRTSRFVNRRLVYGVFVVLVASFAIISMGISVFHVRPAYAAGATPVEVVRTPAVATPGVTPGPLPQVLATPAPPLTGINIRPPNLLISPTPTPSPSGNPFGLFPPTTPPTTPPPTLLPSPTAVPTPTPTGDVPIAPTVDNGDSGLDKYLPNLNLHQKGGPLTEYEETGDNGYSLPTNLGLFDAGDKFISPFKSILMSFHIWVAGIATRMIKIAFFNQLFAGTLGPLAYKLVDAQTPTIFNPLIMIGGAVLMLIAGYNILGRQDAQKGKQILLVAAGGILTALIVFAAPSSYFGGADTAATEFGGAMLGSAGEVSNSLNLSSDHLSGDPQTIALRRITNSLHDQLATQPFCQAILGQKEAVDKYCVRLHHDGTITASEQAAIDKLPTDQQDDARNKLTDQKHDDFNKVVDELKAHYPQAYDRIRGHDAIGAFVDLMISLLVSAIIAFVFTVVALIIIVSRLMYFFSVSIGPDVIPSVLAGPVGQRVFRSWVVLGIFVQLIIQAILGFILAIALIFTYGLFSTNMPWGLKNILIAALFIIMYRKRNTILARVIGEENAPGLVGMRAFNAVSASAGLNMRRAVFAGSGAALGSPELVQMGMDAEKHEPQGADMLRGSGIVRNLRTTPQPDQYDDDVDDEDLDEPRKEPPAWVAKTANRIRKGVVPDSSNEATPNAETEEAHDDSRTVDRRPSQGTSRRRVAVPERTLVEDEEVYDQAKDVDGPETSGLRGRSQAASRRRKDEPEE